MSPSMRPTSVHPSGHLSCCLCIYWLHCMCFCAFVHLCLVTACAPYRLEVVLDSRALTNKVLEVLPVCPEAVQKQLICFLPEVVEEEDHERVVEQLHGLLEQDLNYMAAVLDAVTNMQLAPALQVSAMLDNALNGHQGLHGV